MVLVAVHKDIQKIYSQADAAAGKARCLPAARWRLVSVLRYSCYIPVVLPALSISVAIAAVQEPIMVEGEGQIFEEVMCPTELVLVGEEL